MPGVRWGKTWRLLQKVTYHNKADYSADCFAAAGVLHIVIIALTDGAIEFNEFFHTFIISLLSPFVFSFFYY